MKSDVKRIQDLKVGDIVVGKSTGLAYIITDHFDEYVIAVRTQHISNPSEWQVFTIEQEKKS